MKLIIIVVVIIKNNTVLLNYNKTFSIFYSQLLYTLYLLIKNKIYRFQLPIKNFIHYKKITININNPNLLYTTTYYNIGFIILVYWAYTIYTWIQCIINKNFMFGSKCWYFFIISLPFHYHNLSKN